MRWDQDPKAKTSGVTMEHPIKLAQRCSLRLSCETNAARVLEDLEVHVGPCHPTAVLVDEYKFSFTLPTAGV